jgi:macrolide transport system ATP-binding/permease protein
MRLKHWLYTVPLRLRSLFRRRQVEQELDEELRYHLERQIEEQISKGMTEEEARYAALRAIGGIERRKDECRDMRHVRWIEDLMQDVGYSQRMLRKNPGFTAVAVLTLALGIGANTAIFSVIDALMLKRLSVRNPEQLFMFEGHSVNYHANGVAVPGIGYDFPHPTFEKFRTLTNFFSDVSGIYEVDRFNVTVDGPDGAMDRGQVVVGMASGNYFSNLGVQAARGRTFTPDDDRTPGSHPVAVISYVYWERRFAQAANVVGRTLTLNGTKYDIIGVTAKGFSGEWVGKPVDFWVPFMMASQVMPEVPGGPARFPARVIGRLKPGVKREQAQAAAQLLRQQILMEAFPNPSPARLKNIASHRIELVPAATGYSPQRRSFGQPLAILMIVVGLLLLIACANVANLLLARAAARQREMAVRLALGAGRGRVIRQLLTESALLAGLGGALGLLFAWWGTNALAAFMQSGPVTGPVVSTNLRLDLHPDARVFAFTAALCLTTAILFGLVPAFRSSRVSLTPALMGRGAGSDNACRRFGLGQALVITQVALSLILLIGAGLFARTLSNLKAQDLGFDRDHTLLIWLAPGQTGRPVQALADLCRIVQERLSTIPGARSASVSIGGILDGREGGGPSEVITIQGQAPKPGLLLRYVQISPRFFDTMGIPLLLGRDFSERDSETAPRVAIINETMARFFFGDQNPIGKRLGGLGPEGEAEIVGVVKDTKPGTPRDNPGVIYRPYPQLQRILRVTWSVALRTTGDPSALAAGIRQEIRNIDPNLPVLRINTIKQQLNDVLFQERIVASLSGLFGLLAVALAGLGLYGVVSYTVARRTNEIGIRLALGATPADALRMILKETVALALAGVAIGVPVTLTATRLISSRLFGVGAADPLTIAAAAAALLAVASMAALLPARRAARVDPMVALRHD